MSEETNTYKILFVNIHRMRPGVWNMLHVNTWRYR